MTTAESFGRRRIAPKGPRGEKRPGDVIAAAIMVAKIATGEVEDSADDSKAHHRKGGRKAQAKTHVLESALAQDYDRHWRPHEPATLEAFGRALDQPGLTEHGAVCLRELVLNRPIREQLMRMDWQVVTVANSEPILTSDVPLIRYRGLEHDDGMWILPTATDAFLVIFNHGQIDMARSIERNIRDGVFVEAMNRYVVQHKIDYVYGIDDSHLDFVKRYWAVTETPDA